jgi:hypothetical protein
MQNLQGLQPKQQHLRDTGFNNAMAMHVSGHGTDGDFSMGAVRYYPFCFTLFFVRYYPFCFTLFFLPP